MVDMFMRGGWMMIPLAGCSLIALMIIFERLMYFQRIRGAEDLTHQLLLLLHDGKDTEALRLVEGHSSPLLRVLTGGILQRDRDPLKAMEAESVAELSVMRKGLPALDTIITLAPLLGLLGTILGMIQSFQIMTQAGLGQPHAVTGGVAEALIATATGIFVAVTTLVPYNYFLARVDRERSLIEEWGTRLELALHMPNGGQP